MVATATLERMEEEITLKTIARSIEDLFGVIKDGFIMIDRRFDAIDKRFGDVDRRFAALEARVDGVGFIASQTQDDVRALNEEMRGIHKVIDNLNTRLVRVEGAAGI